MESSRNRASTLYTSPMQETIYLWNLVAGLESNDTLISLSRTPEERRLKTRRPKTSPVTGVDIFPSLTLCGCLGDLAPKCHKLQESRV